MTFGTEKLKVIFCRNAARPPGYAGGLVPEHDASNGRNGRIPLRQVISSRNNSSNLVKSEFLNLLPYVRNVVFQCYQYDFINIFVGICSFYTIEKNGFSFNFDKLFRSFPVFFPHSRTGSAGCDYTIIHV